MENANDPDWEPFVRGQAAYARGRLDAIPRRGQIGRRIAKVSGDLPVVNKVRRIGGKTFVEYRPAGAISFKLYVSDHPDAARRLLYDPEQETDRSGGHRRVDYWVISPDGRYVAFGSSPSGSEDSVLRVLKTRDGSLLPDRLRPRAIRSSRLAAEFKWVSGIAPTQRCGTRRDRLLRQLGRLAPSASWRSARRCAHRGRWRCH